MSKLKPIPEFINEDEEFEFWSMADSTEYLDPAGWRRVPPPIIAGGEDAVFLRMPHALTEEVERLSREKKMSVEEMVRQLVAAGLKQQGLQPGA
ncbi:MAG TPA: CopG family antitoxin [Candidatus Kapabacteria bacterium]|nr:CopG family antitoxin [Candidatus Kapabacteria bacterium]